MDFWNKENKENWKFGDWEKKNYVQYSGIGKIIGDNSRNSNHSKNVLNI